jgi:hypothetical protein
MNVFLAICPPNGQEVHVRWRGHETAETANKELFTLRKLLMGQGKKPYDCYVYESEIPPYGLKAHELDDVDMNFYEETTPADIEQTKKELDRAIYEVGILADAERKGELKENS